MLFFVVFVTFVVSLLLYQLFISFYRCSSVAKKPFSVTFFLDLPQAPRGSVASFRGAWKRLKA